MQDHSGILLAADTQVRHYLIDDDRRAFRLVKKDDGSVVQPMENWLRHHPRQHMYDPNDSLVPLLPVELALRILRHAFFSLLEERLFSEALICATINRGFCRHVFRTFVEEDFPLDEFAFEFPTRIDDVTVARLLSNTFFLLRTIWNQLFTEEVVDEETVPLYTIDLYGKSPFKFQTDTRWESAVPRPYALVGRDGARVHVREVEWETDSAPGFSIPKHGTLAPFPPMFVGETAIFVDSERQGLGFRAKMGFPLLAFSIWVTADIGQSYKRLGVTADMLLRIPAWRRFFDLCRIAFGPFLTIACFPGAQSTTARRFPDHPFLIRKRPAVIPFHVLYGEA